MNKYINHPSCITLTGANGSGKSHLIKYIIKSMDFEVIIIFTNTSFTGAYDYQNNIICLNTIDYDVKLKKIMNIQKKKSVKLLTIYDDVAGSIKDSKVLKTFISQNRHFNTTIIFSAQYYSMISTYMREISQYDIIFDIKTLSSLKGVYENYFVNDFDTFIEFKKKIKNLLKKYHFLFSDKEKGIKTIMLCPSHII